MTRTDDSEVPDFQQWLRLDGKRFVVLGAGQGMGRQASHALSQAGARIFCVDKEADLADDIAKEVGGIAWSGDATERAAVEGLFTNALDPTTGLGGLDGIVDIIGLSRWAALLEVTDDDWYQQHDMNLHQAFLAMQIGGRHMAAGGGGVMVFVASASGLTGAPFHAPYGAAKAGLIALVKSGAVELGPSNVRVNAVAPGVIFTPRMHDLMNEELRSKNRANVPLGRMGIPAEIAGPLLFLASPLSSYVSGQTISVDGGVAAKFPYPTP
jgi:NAD(P)-dependent dehydrogenase (short-subunit alcohol dehydrogenase family)